MTLEMVTQFISSGWEANVVGNKASANLTAIRRKPASLARQPDIVRRWAAPTVPLQTHANKMRPHTSTTLERHSHNVKSLLHPHTGGPGQNTTQSLAFRCMQCCRWGVGSADMA